MRQSNKILLRAFLTLCLLVLFALPALAAMTEDEYGELKVFPGNNSSELSEYVTARRVRAGVQIPTYTSSNQLYELVKKYEGFFPEPYNDSGYQAIGYGTRYEKALKKWPGCTSITEEQAFELLKDDLAGVENHLNQFLQNNSILVNQDQFDALVDFTYNVGGGWTTYRNDDGSWCMLKTLLLCDPSQWTETRVQEAFGAWVYAGGQVLPGLVKRRAEEAELFLSQGLEVAFPDVSSKAWYYDWVNTAYVLDLVDGYEDGTFRPERNVTRAELVQTLANLAQADLSGYTGSSFSDVKASAWYAPAVAWAAEAGLVQGYEDGTFRPEREISRQHACSILARYLRLAGISAGDPVDAFTDDAEMESTSREDVYFCASHSLVSGVGEGRFSPKGLTTRGQLAKLLVGMKRLIGD